MAHWTDAYEALYPVDRSRPDPASFTYSATQPIASATQPIARLALNPLHPNTLTPYNPSATQPIARRLAGAVSAEGEGGDSAGWRDMLGATLCCSAARQRWRRRPSPGALWVTLRGRAGGGGGGRPSAGGAVAAATTPGSRGRTPHSATLPRGCTPHSATLPDILPPQRSPTPPPWRL
eukprot:589730-Prorocentrum_minimum.AAC.1